MDILIAKHHRPRSALQRCVAAVCLQLCVALAFCSLASAQARLHSIKSGLRLATEQQQDRARDARSVRVSFDAPASFVSIELLDASGMVPASGLQRLAKLMGCSPQQRCQVHPRLAVLLAKISQHFGERAIHIVSGYRKQGGFTQKTSRHTMGRAADIQVNGVSRRKLWDYCRTLAQTGCGYYPNSVFVHVDVREEAAQWVDWSQPGSRPYYGTLSRPYTKDEWASADRTRVGRSISRPDEVALTVRVADETGAVVQLVDEQPWAAGLSALAQALLSESKSYAREPSGHLSLGSGEPTSPSTVGTPQPDLPPAALSSAHAFQASMHTIQPLSGNAADGASL